MQNFSPDVCDLTKLNYFICVFFVQCLNALVQHGSSAADYQDAPVLKYKHGKSKQPQQHLQLQNGNNKKYQQQQSNNTATSLSGTLMSKSSSGSSDTEPFYLHPPSIRAAKEQTLNVYSGVGGNNSNNNGTQYGGSVVPNDGLFVNPMRINGGSSTPTSPSGSVSGESFYLHDPQEVIYNRVKDLFGDSDSSSTKEAPTLPHPNALTVKVEVHSSSSGAGSGSEESLSVSSSTSDSSAPVILRNHPKNNVNGHAHAPSVTSSSVSHDHDYEDIYLVREEAKIANKSKASSGGGRSRSRDSGSHSRSASASSAHSTDIVVQYGSHLNNSNSNNSSHNNIVNQRNKLNESAAGPRTRKNDIFSTNGSKKSNLSTRNNTLKNDTYESVCAPEDLVNSSKDHIGTTIHNGGLNNARLLKRVVSAPILQEARGNAHPFNVKEC